MRRNDRSSLMGEDAVAGRVNGWQRQTLAATEEPNNNAACCKRV